MSVVGEGCLGACVHAGKEICIPFSENYGCTGCKKDHFLQLAFSSENNFVREYILP